MARRRDGWGARLLAAGILLAGGWAFADQLTGSTLQLESTSLAPLGGLSSSATVALDLSGGEGTGGAAGAGTAFVPGYPALAPTEEPTCPTIILTSPEGGSWSDGLQWGGGQVPTACNPVVIPAGKSITVDTTTAVASTITVQGTLRFSRFVDSRLELSGGDLIVAPGGRLDMGSDGDELPSSVAAELVLALGTPGQAFGLIVQDGGVFSLRGATKSPWLLADTDIPPGATSAGVTGAFGGGWSTGDRITLGMTASRAGAPPSQSELVTITTVQPPASPDIVGFDPAASFQHVSTGPLVVANLTRNAVIRSAGSTVGVDNAYLRVLTQSATSFTAAYGEFAALGRNQAGRFGVTFDGGSGSVSHSSIRDGLVGVHALGSKGVKLASNVVYQMADVGILLQDGDDGELTANAVHDSASFGINVFSGSSGNVVKDNLVYAGGSSGLVVLTASRNAVQDNKLFSNDGLGFETGTNASSNTVSGNKIHLNAAGGARLGSSADRTLFVGNEVHSNDGHGIRSQSNSGRRNQLALNLSYSALGTGVGLISDGSIVEQQEGSLGFDPSGSPAPNAGGDAGFSSSGGESILLRGVKLSPAGVGTANMSAGEHLLSYNQSQDTGTVRLWGELVVSGGTLSIRGVEQLYPASATEVLVLRGSHTFTIDAAHDQDAVTQLISFVYTEGCWGVYGSVSGGLGAFCSSSGSGIPIPSSNPQFTFSFANGGSPADGDRADFLLYGASKDPETPKALLFESAHPSVNGGRARLLVDPGGALALEGEPGFENAVLLDGSNPSSAPGSLVVLGSATIRSVFFEGLDAAGLQFGSGPLSLSSLFFSPPPGVADAPRAFMTALPPGGNRSFDSLTFENPEGLLQLSNVDASAVSGISLALTGSAGGASGSFFELDPNGAVSWSPDPHPAVPLPAFSGLFSDATGARALTPGDDFALAVAADPAGPFLYVLSRHDSVPFPFQHALVKRDAAGVVLASIPVTANDPSPVLAVDALQRVWLADLSQGLPEVRVYASSLSTFTARTLSDLGMLRPTDLAAGISAGAVLLGDSEGGEAGNDARLVRLDAALAVVSSRTLDAGGDFDVSRAVALRPGSAEVYAAVRGDGGPGNRLFRFSADLAVQHANVLVSAEFPEVILGLAADSSFLYVTGREGVSPPYTGTVAKYDGDTLAFLSSTSVSGLGESSGSGLPPNLALAPDGTLVELWPSLANAGDFLAVLRSSGLAVLASELYDGGEDRPSGRPAVLSSAAVFGVGFSSTSGAGIEAVAKSFFGAPPAVLDLIVTSSQSLPPGTYTFNHLRVSSGAVLTAQGNFELGAGVTIFASSVTVDPGSGISANGQGFPGSGAPDSNGLGPGGGQGGATGHRGAGAGHGGAGGASNSGLAGGAPYGSIAQPQSLGSSGGTIGLEPGGAGGGALRLIVAGSATVNGFLTAAGGAGQGNGTDCSGGGSGGSILLQAVVFQGAGLLAASGGPGASCSGSSSAGGAGGRIAVYFSTDAFTGTLAATGGSGSSGGTPSGDGQAGTVVRVPFGTFVESGVLRVWTGEGQGAQASDPANWDTGVPQAGDSVLFDAASTVLWDLAVPLSTFAVAPGWDAPIQVSTPLFVGAGGLLLEGTGVLSFEAGSGPHGVLGPVALSGGELRVDGSSLTVAHASGVEAAGTVRLLNGAGLRTPRLSVQASGGFVAEDLAGAGACVLGSTSASAGLEAELDGLVQVSSLSVQGLGPSGLLLGANAAVETFDRVEFSTPSADGGAALRVEAFISDFSMSFLAFLSTGYAVNIDASGMPPDTGFVLFDASGPRAGSFYENDPQDAVAWLPDPVAAPSIEGFVTHLGVQGGGKLAAVFLSTSFLNTADMALVEPLDEADGFRFDLADGLPLGTTVYVAAFVDNNATGELEPGEEFGALGGTTTPAAFLFGAGVTFSQQELFIEPLVDPTLAVLQGTVTFAGSGAGTFRLEAFTDNFFEGTPSAVFSSTEAPPWPYGVTVPGDAAYFLRAYLDQDADQAVDAGEPAGVYAPSGFGAEPVFAGQGEVVAGLDFALAVSAAGQGTGQVQPAAAAAAGTFTGVVRYVVGPDTMTAGGQVVLGLPDGWGPLEAIGSTGPNRVLLSVQGGGGASVQLDADPVEPGLQDVAGFSFAPAVVTSGSLPAGATVVFNLTEVDVPCALGAAVFVLASAADGTLTPEPLASGSPAAAVAAGAAVAMSASPSPAVLTQFTTSQALTLGFLDECGNEAPLSTATAVEVAGRLFDPQTGLFAPDPDLLLAASPAAASTPTLTLAYGVGEASKTFVARALTVGERFIRSSFTLEGLTDELFFPVEVLSGLAISSPSVSTGAFLTGAASVTFSPDKDGAADAAFIHFTPGSGELSWRVRVASSPWSGSPAALWEAAGKGFLAPGSLGWDGRFNRTARAGQSVPNGTYFIRVEAGGATDDSLQATVAARQFAGRVSEALSTPVQFVAGVQVSAFGPVQGLTETDGQGRYVLAGLRAGSYVLQFKKDGFVTLSTSAVAASSETAVDAALGRLASLTVIPTLTPGATRPLTLNGQLAVHTTSWSEAFFSPIRLPAGTTVFDDGGAFDPSLQKFVFNTRIPFKVTVGTYAVDGSLAGFFPVSTTTFIPAGGRELTLPPFTPLPSLSGTVRLSTAVVAAPNPGGLTVTVSAVRVGTAAALGGAAFVSLPAGTTSAAFSIAGVAPGSYLVKAAAPGFAESSTGPVALGGTDLAGVDPPPLASGGVLVGTVTVQDDSSGFAPLAGSTAPIQVQLTVWAPGSGVSANTAVLLATASVPSSAAYRLAGLTTGTSYQLYVRPRVAGPRRYDLAGGQPRLLFLPGSGLAQQDLLLTPSSGTVAVAATLPALPAPDFRELFVAAAVLNSAEPAEVGRSFDFGVSTALPGFLCGGTTPPAGGVCGVGISSATFRLENLRTESLRLTFHYRATGQALSSVVNVVNGATTPVQASLTGSTFSLSGRLNNQVSNPLFNTHAKILANAPFAAPPGYPAGLSSTTARIEAVRREFSQLGSAVPFTPFDAANTRVGFLTEGGTYTISGLAPGFWLVRTLPLRAAAGTPVLVPSVDRLVSVSSFNVAGVDFTLNDGFTVSGTASLAGGLKDARLLGLRLVNSRGEVVASTTAALGVVGTGLTANSASFQFARVPAGAFYTLELRDLTSPVRYVARPRQVPDPAVSPGGLQGDLSGQDLTLLRAGAVGGRLRDANSGQLVTEDNAFLLASNFRIFAIANPFVEGGFTLAESSVAGRPIRADGTFVLGPLLPGIPYDIRLEQSSWDPAFLAQGSQNYAPIRLSGVTVEPGQAKDLGILDLRQGQSLSGRASEPSGAPAVNVEVQAKPSFLGSPLVVRTRTAADGSYTLWVSSFVSRFYDVTAARREANAEAAEGAALYEEQTLLAVDLTRRTTADFVLTPLLGGVTGQVRTQDGGPLSYPFGAQKGFPAAAVFLQPSGIPPLKNPLGDIEAVTALDGTFSLLGLSTGTYDLRAVSIGYAVAAATVTVGTQTVSAGSLVLPVGATAVGRIRKPDLDAPEGFSCPSDHEVAGIVAANVGFTEFVVGTAETDPVLRTVCSYTMSGFKPGVAYQLGFLPEDPDAEVVLPPEGAVLFSVAESSATRTLHLTFRPETVACLASARSLGSDLVGLRFVCPDPLRDETEPDDDLSLILTKSTAASDGTPFVSPDGTGVLGEADKTLSEDRRVVEAVYALAAGEDRFSLRLDAFVSKTDPNTGENFRLLQTFDFFTGLESATGGGADNLRGCLVKLEAAGDEDERSSVSCLPGTFLVSGSTDAEPGTGTRLGFQKAPTEQGASAQALAKGLLLTDNERRAYGDPGAVPDLLARAKRALAEGRIDRGAFGAQGTVPQAATVNPLSAFYNIFLPAGISSALKKQARITLSYDPALSSATSINDLNIWFFNPLTNRFELEDGDKSVDTINNTISANVSHFSVFTVLDSTPVFTSTNPFAGADISVYNFPNPFNLEAKTRQVNSSAGSGGFTAGQTVAFRGTLIRLGIPPGAQSEGRIRFYNVAGELVRDIPVQGLTAGTFEYFEWDGRNQSGKDVASGIYIGEVTIGGLQKHWKLALIKDGRYK